MADPNFADKTIWTGDNLDILRGMNSECVDLIYLDPPFNSNRNYAAPVGSKAAGAAFKDTWTLSDLDVAWMGLIADEHPAMSPGASLVPCILFTWMITKMNVDCGMKGGRRSLEQGGFSLEMRFRSNPPVASISNSPLPAPQSAPHGFPPPRGTTVGVTLTSILSRQGRGGKRSRSWLCPFVLTTPPIQICSDGFETRLPRSLP